MPTYSYRIDPILGSRTAEAPLERLVEAACRQAGLPELAPLPPPLLGWRLQLLADGAPVGVQEFAGNESGFDTAQQIGNEWLEVHGCDVVGQRLARIGECSRRMTWDREYRPRAHGGRS